MSTTQHLAVVRRNQYSTFAMLSEALAEEPNVRVIWDRRHGDQRRGDDAAAPGDRRQGERRRLGSETWQHSDYMLVSVSEAQSPRDATPPSVHVESAITEDVQFEISAAIRSDLSVLISRGDPVTRRALARHIHRRSDRANRPFVVVSRDAFLSVFGRLHRGGPFEAPGADTRHAPRVDMLQGGTVLIEEVADLTLEQQAELLLFLNREPVHRGDARMAASPKLRVISATGQWLLSEVARKRFRADLFYRLNAIHLVLPTGSVQSAR